MRVLKEKLASLGLNFHTCKAEMNGLNLQSFVLHISEAYVLLLSPISL